MFILKSIIYILKVNLEGYVKGIKREDSKIMPHFFGVIIG